MTAAALLARLRSRGITLHADGHRVRVAGRLGSGDRKWLAKHERDVAALLRKEDASSTAAPPFRRLPGGGVVFPPRHDRPWQEIYPNRDAERRAEAGLVIRQSAADRDANAAAAAAWADAELARRVGPWERMTAWVRARFGGES